MSEWSWARTDLAGGFDTILTRPQCHLKVQTKVQSYPDKLDTKAWLKLNRNPNPDLIIVRPKIYKPQIKCPELTWNHPKPEFWQKRRQSPVLCSSLCPIPPSPPNGFPQLVILKPCQFISWADSIAKRDPPQSWPLVQAWPQLDPSKIQNLCLTWLWLNSAQVGDRGTKTNKTT